MDDIIDLESRRKARREPLQARQAKLLARLKKKHEEKRLPKRIQPERLIWAREMHGFSIDDWADIMEVAPEIVQEWEDGKSVPTPEQMETYTLDTFGPGWFYEPVEEGWPGLEGTSLRFH